MSVLISLTISCAQVRSVSGGDKDVTSPVVLIAEPPVLTTSFAGNEFAMTFDEYVSLGNVSSELIVSPPLKKRPHVKLRNKTVEVKWDEELEPNTTYTFNFGDAIADVNEGNIANDLIYVFSTGPVIDSLSVAGTVADAWTGNALQGVKVMLYRSMDSSNVYLNQPSFFTRTKSDGSFMIPFLSSGNYQLVALDDTDGDYKLGEEEAFAFSSEPVSSSINDSIVQQHKLRMSTMLPVKPDFRNYAVDSSGAFGFKWNRSFADAEIRVLNEPFGVSSQRVENADSVIAFLIGKPNDKYNQVEISLNGFEADTIEVPFFNEALTSGNKLEIDVKSQITSKQIIYFSSTDKQELSASPLLALLEDSVSVSATIIPDPMMLNRFILSATLIEGKTYNLSVYPGTFNNAAGITNDTLSTTFRTYREDDLGKIILHLTHSYPESQLILEISNNEGVVVRQKGLGANAAVNIPSLVPGEHHARIYLDENGNNQWDPADYKSGKQPEQVWILLQKMNIRGNWDVEVDWQLSE